MKTEKFKKENIKLGKEILKNLYIEKNTISVSLVGSFSEHFDLKKAGDIDVVVICKKLTNKYFNKCKKRVFALQNNLSINLKKKIDINTNFGPIKFDTSKNLVIHLMIYDLKSHTNHTISSPFTCLDWERSNFFMGVRLKEISPVLKLQLRDFYLSRRGIDDYLKDITNNCISYRKYLFKKDSSPKLIKKNFKIDKLNQSEFIYHIIKFLIINLIKFEINKNIRILQKDIVTKILEITKDRSYVNIFIEIEKIKSTKNLIKKNNYKKFVKNFISYFNKYIDAKYKKSKIIKFVRHQKTSFSNNIFIGQFIDPDITKIKNIELLYQKDIDLCFSSPLVRCIKSAKLITNIDIIKVNELKEIDYGLAEGLNLKKLSAKFPEIIKAWNNKRDIKFPKGESTNDVKNRLSRFININLNEKYLKKNRNILIMTHNVVLRVLIGNYFLIPKSEFFKINVDYLSFYEFLLLDNKLIPNIKREKFNQIFKDFYA